MIEITGQIVDVVAGRIFPGSVKIEGSAIVCIEERAAESVSKQYVLPGLVNAHGHVESSLLVPSSFACAAVIHGDVGGVYDPHELANVCGLDGVKFMLDDAKRVPFKFAFGAPSCVPATNSDVETSGAALGVSEVRELLESGDIRFLSEVMNAPAVIGGDPKFMEMISIARDNGLPVDGHCPGFHGEDLQKYIDAGISTDHECTTLEEAVEKLERGLQFICIREGSAAKNFDALHSLLRTHPERVMLCSDDIHPHDLMKGHMNKLVARATNLSYDPISVLRTVTLNPVRHYHLNIGLLQEGDPADLIVVDSLSEMNVFNTFIDGVLVAENGKCLLGDLNKVSPINFFKCSKIKPSELRLEAQGASMRVIGVQGGQLITTEEIVSTCVSEGAAVSNVEQDIVKLVVVNRYQKALPAVAFVRGLGIKRGALASSVAHDCHQIVAAGVNDDEIALAVNAVIEHKGGLVAVDGEEVIVLPLPVGGIMTDSDAETVAQTYEGLLNKGRELGAQVVDPWMTLSFMSLSVIPELKLTDKGLFKILEFRHVSVFGSDADPLLPISS